VGRDDATRCVEGYYPQRTQFERMPSGSCASVSWPSMGMWRQRPGPARDVKKPTLTRPPNRRSRPLCQSASNRAPGSAWKRDPFLALGRACPS